jgi:class 3 adenylate cyclase
MLPKRADHGRAALRLALDLHAAAASVDVGDGRHLHVRVGLHAGPITTGVIGALCVVACGCAVC